VVSDNEHDEKCVLIFIDEIGEPKVDWLECLREGLTFGAPIYVTFLLKEEKGTKEEKVFMGELPSCAAGDFCDQWRGTRHCQPTAPFTGLAF